MGGAGRIREGTVYLITGAMTVASFRPSLPSFNCLGPTIRRSSSTGRKSLCLRCFFLLALVGYLRKGSWRTDDFEHWLVLSLIVAFMGQAMFMSFSGRLFDFEFDAAHLLKKGQLYRGG